MNTQPPRSINPNIVIPAIFISASIVVVIAQAIAGDQFWTLVGGFAVFSVLLVALAWIGIHLFNRYTDTVLKRDSLRYDHAQAMVKYGWLFTGKKYEQIAAPEPELDELIDMHGVTNSTVAPYRAEALEVLALSKQVMRDKPDQIVPYSKAKMNDYFSGKEGQKRWHDGCQWLIVHQWAAPRMKGEKNLGTFCTSGTVTQLYERLNQK